MVGMMVGVRGREGGSEKVRDQLRMLLLQQIQCLHVIPLTTGNSTVYINHMISSRYKAEEPHNQEDNATVVYLSVKVRLVTGDL